MIKLLQIKQHKEQKIHNQWRNNWKKHAAYHFYDDEKHTDIVLKIFSDGTKPELSANQTFYIDSHFLQYLIDIIKDRP